MSRIKLLTAIGGISLAVAAVFATRANKKYVSVNKAFFFGGLGNYYIIYNGAGASPFTTTNNFLGQLSATIYTFHGLAKVGGQLITDIGITPLYYK